VGGPVEHSRVALVERLRDRRAEIEDAIIGRVYAIDGSRRQEHEEWIGGVRTTVAAALEHVLTMIERGEHNPLPVPVQLLAQTRLAVRSGISLDTVMRRYFAGYTLIGDFIVQESGAIDLRESWLKRLLREQAAMFERLLTVISDEYRREESSQPITPMARQVQHVRRLLGGELVEASELQYPINAYHVGVVATGQNVEEALRELASTSDRQLFVVEPNERTWWAWLAARIPGDVDRLAQELERCCDATESTTFGLGEPALQLQGWRLTHRQALAAHGVASECSKSVVRHAHVALLAAALQDEVLAESIRQRIYPSLVDPMGGRSVRETVAAYLQAGRNVSSAAAALGISRSTVASRLRTVEAHLERSLNAETAELELALELLEFEEAHVYSESSAPGASGAGRVSTVPK
jgi:hypothetical protein